MNAVHGSVKLFLFVCFSLGFIIMRKMVACYAAVDLLITLLYCGDMDDIDEDPLTTAVADDDVDKMPMKTLATSNEKHLAYNSFRKIGLVTNPVAPKRNALCRSSSSALAVKAIIIGIVTRNICSASQPPTTGIIK